MNAEESPDYIVSQERNRLLAEKYGKNSDIYRVRVLGEFPWANPNCVISSEDLMACTRTDIYECMRIGRYEGDRLVLPKQIGVDFARFGNDESTVFARVGNAVIKWQTFDKVDPNVVAAYAIRLRKELGWTEKEAWFVCDAGGMGQGVMKTFLDTNSNVVEFHNGGSSTQSDYYDKITEGMFDLGFKAAKRVLHIPNDPRLIQQLATRQYGMDDKRGKAKLRLESKEKYVERMRRESGSIETVSSPDRADGLVMAFYDQVLAAGRIARRAS
jgi:phage terminase large subunit